MVFSFHGSFEGITPFLPALVGAGRDSFKRSFQ
jgi:hypothetical protein